MINHINIFPGDIIELYNSPFFVFSISREGVVSLYNLKTGVNLETYFGQGFILKQRGPFSIIGRSEICKIGCPVKKLLGECDPMCTYVNKEGDISLRKKIRSIEIGLRLSVDNEFFKEFLRNEFSHGIYPYELCINSVYILEIYIYKKVY